MKNENNIKNKNNQPSIFNSDKVRKIMNYTPKSPYTNWPPVKK